MSKVPEQRSELSGEHVNLQAVEKPALSLVALASTLHPRAQYRLQVFELGTEIKGGGGVKCRQSGWRLPAKDTTVMRATMACVLMEGLASQEKNSVILKVWSLPPHLDLT